jgi:putative transposase
MAESFFATLECELIDRAVFENRNHARMAIFDFIEVFYNPWRRHSSIGNLSPRRIREALAHQPGIMRCCLNQQPRVRKNRATPTVRGRSAK